MLRSSISKRTPSSSSPTTSSFTQYYQHHPSTTNSSSSSSSYVASRSGQTYLFLFQQQQQQQQQQLLLRQQQKATHHKNSTSSSSSSSSSVDDSKNNDNESYNNNNKTTLHQSAKLSRQLSDLLSQCSKLSAFAIQQQQNQQQQQQQSAIHFSFNHWHQAFELLSKTLENQKLQQQKSSSTPAVVSTLHFNLALAIASKCRQWCCQLPSRSKTTTTTTTTTTVKNNNNTSQSSNSYYNSSSSTLLSPFQQCEAAMAVNNIPPDSHTLNIFMAASLSSGDWENALDLLVSEMEAAASSAVLTPDQTEETIKLLSDNNNNNNNINQQNICLINHQSVKVALRAAVDGPKEQEFGFSSHGNKTSPSSATANSIHRYASSFVPRWNVVLQLYKMFPQCFDGCGIGGSDNNNNNLQQQTQMISLLVRAVMTRAELDHNLLKTWQNKWSSSSSNQNNNKKRNNTSSLPPSPPVPPPLDSDTLLNLSTVAERCQNWSVALALASGAASVLSPRSEVVATLVATAMKTSYRCRQDAAVISLFHHHCYLTQQQRGSNDDERKNTSSNQVNLRSRRQRNNKDDENSSNNNINNTSLDDKALSVVALSCARQGKLRDLLQVRDVAKNKNKRKYYHCITNSEEQNNDDHSNVIVPTEIVTSLLRLLDQQFYYVLMTSSKNHAAGVGNNHTDADADEENANAADKSNGILNQQRSILMKDWLLANDNNTPTSTTSTTESSTTTTTTLSSLETSLQQQFQLVHSNSIPWQQAINTISTLTHDADAICFAVAAEILYLQQQETTHRNYDGSSVENTNNMKQDQSSFSKAAQAEAIVRAGLISSSFSQEKAEAALKLLQEISFANNNNNHSQNSTTRNSDQQQQQQQQHKKPFALTVSTLLEIITKATDNVVDNNNNKNYNIDILSEALQYCIKLQFNDGPVFRRALDKVLQQLSTTFSSKETAKMLLAHHETKKSEDDESKRKSIDTSSSSSSPLQQKYSQPAGIHPQIRSTTISRSEQQRQSSSSLTNNNNLLLLPKMLQIIAMLSTSTNNNNIVQEIVELASLEVRIHQHHQTSTTTTCTKLVLSTLVKNILSKLLLLVSSSTSTSNSVAGGGTATTAAASAEGDEEAEDVLLVVEDLLSSLEVADQNENEKVLRANFSDSDLVSSMGFSQEYFDQHLLLLMRNNNSTPSSNTNAQQQQQDTHHHHHHHVLLPLESRRVKYIIRLTHLLFRWGINASPYSQEYRLPLQFSQNISRFVLKSMITITTISTSSSSHNNNNNHDNNSSPSASASASSVEAFRNFCWKELLYMYNNMFSKEVKRDFQVVISVAKVCAIVGDVSTAIGLLCDNGGAGDSNHQSNDNNKNNINNTQRQRRQFLGLPSSSSFVDLLTEEFSSIPRNVFNNNNNNSAKLISHLTDFYGNALPRKSKVKLLQSSWQTLQEHHHQNFPTTTITTTKNADDGVHEFSAQNTNNLSNEVLQLFKSHLRAAPETLTTRSIMLVVESVNIQTTTKHVVNKNNGIPSQLMDFLSTVQTADLSGKLTGRAALAIVCSLYNNNNNINNSVVVESSNNSMRQIQVIFQQLMRQASLEGLRMDDAVWKGASAVWLVRVARTLLLVVLQQQESTTKSTTAMMMMMELFEEASKLFEKICVSNFSSNKKQRYHNNTKIASTKDDEGNETHLLFSTHLKEALEGVSDEILFSSEQQQQQQQCKKPFLNNISREEMILDSLVYVALVSIVIDDRKQQQHVSTKTATSTISTPHHHPSSSSSRGGSSILSMIMNTTTQQQQELLFGASASSSSTSVSNNNSNNPTATTYSCHNFWKQEAILWIQNSLLMTTTTTASSTSKLVSSIASKLQHISSTNNKDQHQQLLETLIESLTTKCQMCKNNIDLLETMLVSLVYPLLLGVVCKASSTSTKSESLFLSPKLSLFALASSEVADARQRFLHESTQQQNDENENINALSIINHNFSIQQLADSIIINNTNVSHQQQQVSDFLLNQENDEISKLVLVPLILSLKRNNNSCNVVASASSPSSLFSLASTFLQVCVSNNAFKVAEMIPMIEISPKSPQQQQQSSLLLMLLKQDGGGDEDDAAVVEAAWKFAIQNKYSCFDAVSNNNKSTMSSSFLHSTVLPVLCRANDRFKFLVGVEIVEKNLLSMMKKASSFTSSTTTENYKRITIQLVENLLRMTVIDETKSTTTTTATTEMRSIWNNFLINFAPQIVVQLLEQQQQDGDSNNKISSDFQIKIRQEIVRVCASQKEKSAKLQFSLMKLMMTKNNPKKKTTVPLSLHNDDKMKRNQSSSSSSSSVLSSESFHASQRWLLFTNGNINTPTKTIEYLDLENVIFPELKAINTILIVVGEATTTTPRTSPLINKFSASIIRNTNIVMKSFEQFLRNQQNSNSNNNEDEQSAYENNNRLLLLSTLGEYSKFCCLSTTTTMKNDDISSLVLLERIFRFVFGGGESILLSSKTSDYLSWTAKAFFSQDDANRKNINSNKNGNDQDNEGALSVYETCLKMLIQSAAKSGSCEALVTMINTTKNSCSGSGGATTTTVHSRLLNLYLPLGCCISAIQQQQQQQQATERNTHDRNLLQVAIANFRRAVDNSAKNNSSKSSLVGLQLSISTRQTIEKLIVKFLPEVSKHVVDPQNHQSTNFGLLMKKLDQILIVEEQHQQQQVFVGAESKSTTKKMYETTNKRISPPKTWQEVLEIIEAHVAPPSKQNSKSSSQQQTDTGDIGGIGMVSSAVKILQQETSKKLLDTAPWLEASQALAKICVISPNQQQQQDQQQQQRLEYFYSVIRRHLWRVEKKCTSAAVVRYQATRVAVVALQHQQQQQQKDQKVIRSQPLLYELMRHTASTTTDDSNLIEVKNNKYLPLSVAILFHLTNCSSSSSSVQQRSKKSNEISLEPLIYCLESVVFSSSISTGEKQEICNEISEIFLNSKIVVENNNKSSSKIARQQGKKFVSLLTSSPISTEILEKVLMKVGSLS